MRAAKPGRVSTLTGLKTARFSIKTVRFEGKMVRRKQHKAVAFYNISDLESFTKIQLAGVHFTFVGFVVVAAEVQHAVKY